MLFCPSCGCSYPLKDTVTDQNIQSDLPNSKLGTKIISGKRPRKHYDSFGSLIPDDDEAINQDIASGRRVVYYHEQKQENKEARKIR